MTIVEFLRARLAEDEADQGSPRSDWHKGWCDLFSYDPTSCDCRLVVRVLAEVQAKRRLVDEHQALHEHGLPGRCAACIQGDGYGGWRLQRHPCSTLRLLTLPYAEHTDYQQEWRPEIPA